MEFLTLSLHQATECFFMRKESEMKTIEIITLILSIVLIALIIGGLFYYIHHNKKREQALVNPVNQTGDLAILNDRLNALTQAVNTQLNQQNQDALKNTEKWTETASLTKSQSEANNQKFVELRQDFNQLKTQDLKNLAEQQHAVILKLTGLIENIQNNTKSVEETNRNVTSLNNIFYNTKLRGNVGEFTLETLLSNILGTDKKIWEAQYPLFTDKNASQTGNVDFLIHTSNKGEDIAIDAKFPLDNYRRLIAAIENQEDSTTINQIKSTFKKDLMAKINEVTKYINPKNNLNSAILFIPSESVFNFVVDEFPEVLETAISKKVWLASPTTLASVLNIINEFLRDYELNNNLEKTKGEILKLKQEYDRFEDRWDKVLKNIMTLSNSAKDLDITVNKIKNQHQRIADYQFEDENS